MTPQANKFMTSRAQKFSAKDADADNGQLNRGAINFRPRRRLGAVLAAALVSIIGTPLALQAAPTVQRALTPATSSSTIAVVIGNQDYEGGTPDVPFAGNDAQGMRRFLADQMAVAAKNTLSVENANLETFIHIFGNGETGSGRLGRMVRPGVSDIIVYYSGHGVPGAQDGRAYLLPVNADPKQPATQAYALDDLYDNLARLHARTVTVYLEASFTGRSPAGALIETEPRIPPAVAPFDMPDGIAVITASAPEQMAAWDRENRHGLFTEYLLRGLYGAADVWGHGNGDGDVTLNEVKTYLDKEMTFAARRDHGRVQSVDVSGVTDFVLARFDPADPPLRPLVSGRDVATAAVNEVPLPEDVVAAQPEKVVPTLRQDAIEPLPIPENQPIAGTDPNAFDFPDDVSVPSVPTRQPILASLPDVDPGLGYDAAELNLWREVSTSENPEDLKVYLLRYPNGQFVDVAKIRFRRLLDGLRAERQLRDQEYRQLLRIQRLNARNARREARILAERQVRTDDWLAPPPRHRARRYDRPWFDPRFGRRHPNGPPPRGVRGF